MNIGSNDTCSNISYCIHCNPMPPTDIRVEVERVTQCPQQCTEHRHQLRPAHGLATVCVVRRGQARHDCGRLHLVLHIPRTAVRSPQLVRHLLPVGGVGCIMFAKHSENRSSSNLNKTNCSLIRQFGDSELFLYVKILSAKWCHCRLLPMGGFRRISYLGPFTCKLCYVKKILEIRHNPPPRNANNVEPYIFVTFFSGESDTLPPPAALRVERPELMTKFLC